MAEHAKHGLAGIAPSEFLHQVQHVEVLVAPYRVGNAVRHSIDGGRRCSDTTVLAFVRDIDGAVHSRGSNRDVHKPKNTKLREFSEPGEPLSTDDGTIKARSFSSRVALHDV